MPRQAGLSPHVRARVVFAPYITQDFVRGLESFSHIWLIWDFHCLPSSGTVRPTVRPPRLGGNSRVGVFATRSPFRPNPIGISAVRLLSVERGPSLLVAGADLVDGSPIYDIKPYLPYADSIPEARAGYADAVPRQLLRVELPGEAVDLPHDYVDALREVLSQDPRPAYQDDPNRVYHIIFRPYELDFSVSDGTAHVISIRPISP